MAQRELTARQELFCQGLLAGKPADQAYADAGYRPSRPHASRLATNGNVVARLAELRKPVVAAVQMTLETHLNDLLSLRDKATTAGQLGPAVTAEVHRGKAAGLYVERRISRNETTITIRDEALRTINDWVAEQLAGEDGSTAELGETRPLLLDSLPPEKTRH